jgi:hypothetical protein
VSDCSLLKRLYVINELFKIVNRSPALAAFVGPDQLSVTQLAPKQADFRAGKVGAKPGRAKSRGRLEVSLWD